MSHPLFPVNDIHQLDELPVVLLAYESGSSGEFLAAALSKSFDGFYRARIEWENDWRCLFQDAFGRALSRGDHEIDVGFMLRKFNHVLMDLDHQDQRFMVTMHPRPSASVDFVRQNLASRPMIKITCRERLSKQFRKLSCFYKLGSGDHDIVHRLDLEDEQGWVDRLTNPGIEVEWRDIILDHPAREFERVQRLLGQTGDWDVFYAMLEDYLARNQKILQEIPVDQ